MIFKEKYINDIKIVSKFNLNMIKLHKKRLNKSRNQVVNKADSWRKKKNFLNIFLKNFFNLSFTRNFQLFVLLRDEVETLITKNICSAFFKNSVIPSETSGSFVKFNKLFIILIHKNFSFFFPINAFLSKNSVKELFFNKSNSSLDIINSNLIWINTSILKLTLRWFSGILKTSFNFIFIKLKYKGKNYRWHRKKKGLVLRFGHSHLIYSRKPTSLFLKKKGRMKIMFFGTNKELIYLFLQNLIKWKPSNVYTGRGLRLSRQRLLKKAGKVSAYR